MFNKRGCMYVYEIFCMDSYIKWKVILINQFIWLKNKNIHVFGSKAPKAFRSFMKHSIDCTCVYYFTIATFCFIKLESMDKKKYCFLLFACPFIYFLWIINLFSSDTLNIIYYDVVIFNR